MKYIVKTVSLIVLGLFMFTLTNVKSKGDKQPEQDPKELYRKISLLRNELGEIRTHVSFQEDSALLQELREMRETLKQLKVNIPEAGEAETFITEVKCNQIEVWIDNFKDSIQIINNSI